MKYVKVFFAVFAVSIFAYFVIGQSVLPKDVIDDSNICYKLDTVWYEILPDGSEKVIEVPGKCSNEVILETVLPDALADRTNCIIFRGEDLRAYVGGELRKDYSTKDTRWFGERSPESYVMIPITPQDAGKRLRIEMETDIGILYDVYAGSNMGIWMHILGIYSVEIMVAALTLVLGIVTILASIALKIIYKKSIDLQYLGWGVTFAAIWLVVNSVFRQIIFPNLSIANDLPFLMVMLIPFPFLIYMNMIQKERYSKVYTIVGVILMLNCIMCCTMYVTGIKDLYKSFIYIAAGCLIAISVFSITIMLDIKSRKIREYRYVAIGILSAFVAAAIQLISYFGRRGIFSGVTLAIGLIILLVFSVINTARNIFMIEQDKRSAVMASEAKGRFLANMSHEIRTPINAVIGMDEMILRESREENVREYAMDIMNAGQNLLSLINDILDFSKIESGKMELVPVEYDLSSVLHDVLNMITVKARDKGLKVEADIDNSLPSKLWGDDVRIRQILLNLMNNAVKYTDEGYVKLTVHGKTEGENAVIHFEVVDSGIGIREEDLSKLFLEFERIEENKNRNIEGTGLGLSITVKLLELMESRLNVESVYQKGSTFSFELIQRIVDSEPIGNLEERIRLNASSYDYKVSFVAPDANILIVDDNFANIKVLANLLKETKIKIDTAISGYECIEKTIDKKYDIIFLDHMMNDMDGIETLHRIRQEEDNPNRSSVIIVLTANAVSGAKEMYIKEGFDDFLSKPVVYSKLENMIIKYLPEEKVSVPDKTSYVKPEDTCEEEPFENMTDVNMDVARLYNKDNDILKELFVDYYNMIDAEADALSEWFEKLLNEENDEALKQYRVKVHSMKTSSNMIGAIYLGGVARMLEIAAINADYDTIRRVTPVFLREWRKFKENLSPVSDMIKENQDEKAEFNPQLVKEQLNLLVKALENMDVDSADGIVMLLKQFCYPEEMNGEMEKIYTAVTNLDAGQVRCCYQKLYGE